MLLLRRMLDTKPVTERDKPVSTTRRGEGRSWPGRAMVCAARKKCRAQKVPRATSAGGSIGDRRATGRYVCARGRLRLERFGQGRIEREAASRERGRLERERLECSDSRNGLYLSARNGLYL